MVLSQKTKMMWCPTVRVADKPTAPENLVPSDVFAETCKLSWSPPADDGGGNINSESGQTAAGFMKHLTQGVA